MGGGGGGGGEGGERDRGTNTHHLITTLKIRGVCVS